MSNISINFFEGGYCFLSQCIEDIAGNFPTLHDVIDIISKNRSSYKRFMSLEKSQRNDFYEFMTGVKGLSIRNDLLFTKIFDIKINKALVENLLESIVENTFVFYNPYPRCSSHLSPFGSFVIADLDAVGHDNKRTHIVITRHSGESFNNYSDASELYNHVSHMELDYTDNHIDTQFTDAIVVVIFDQMPAAIDSNSYITTNTVPANGDYPNIRTIFISLDVFSKRGLAFPINSSLEGWLSFICFQDANSILYLSNNTKYMYSVYYSLYQYIKKPFELINILCESQMTLIQTSNISPFEIPDSTQVRMFE